MDKVLLNNLKQSIPLALNTLNNTLTSLIPLNFQNYLKFNTENIGEALNKVADVTSE